MKIHEKTAVCDRSILVYLYFLHFFQDYSNKNVHVVSRARIDDLTSYVSDSNTDNHNAMVSASSLCLR